MHLTADNFLHLKYAKVLSPMTPYKITIILTVSIWNEVGFHFPADFEASWNPLNDWNRTKYMEGHILACGAQLGKILLKVASIVYATVLVFLLFSRYQDLRIVQMQASLWLQARTQPEVHSHTPGYTSQLLRLCTLEDLHWLNQLQLRRDAGFHFLMISPMFFSKF